MCTRRKGLSVPLTFSSREQLLQRLFAAIPDFDQKLLREGSGETHIIFAETVELTEGHIAELFGRQNSCMCSRRKGQKLHPRTALRLPMNDEYFQRLTRE